MMDLHFGVLFILGIGLFGGLVGGCLFQKIKVPQVVGYIIIGLIIGQSGLNLVRSADITMLNPFNMFALGIIGFLVGGELKIEIFKKYFRQLSVMLIAEGMLAFIFVGLAVFIVLYELFHSVPIALASAMVFGAIASATDPASTIDVLWEYRSRGVLTTSIIAIVALDDALAMTLYGVGTSAAELVTTHTGSILAGVAAIGFDLIGALLLGAIFACILVFIVAKMGQTEKWLAFSIALMLLLISLSMKLHMDVILATMTLGFMLTNLLPKQSEELFKIMRGMSVPIYVLFFVLVGARLEFSTMPGWLWIIVAVYIVGRTAGKVVGAYLGARMTGAEPAVRRYLGMGLFAQGGVAIGLSIVASQHLRGIMIQDNLPLGDAIIFGVTATTMIVQLAGPPMVKLAIKLAGEIGRNVTEEDIIKSLKVEDVMIKDYVSLSAQEPLSSAVHTIVSHDFSVFPVVNADYEISGILSLDGLKNILTDQDSWRWLVCEDAMVPIEHRTYPKEQLEEIYDFMQKNKVDQMPVMQSRESNKPVGLLDMKHTLNYIERTLIQKKGNIS